jgi:hypothetical protein
MIDLKNLKEKIQSNDKLKHTAIADILQEQPDTISEEQYILLVPILLKLSKSQEVLA